MFSSPLGLLENQSHCVSMPLLRKINWLIFAQKMAATTMNIKNANPPSAVYKSTVEVGMLGSKFFAAMTTIAPMSTTATSVLAIVSRVLVELCTGVSPFWF